MDPDTMAALVTRLENRLRAAWIAAIRELRTGNGLRGLEARIAASDVDGLVAGVERAIAAYANELAAGYVHAAQRAARAIDAFVPGPFRFDLADPDAVAWMQRVARETAASLLEEQQAVARRVVQLGIRRGDSPARIAEDVRTSIGLNQAQVDQVDRYRSLLEGADYRTARSYELADGRYDAMLARAEGTGVVLGEERIGAMVGRYRDNWVRFRADGIALADAQLASHAGVDAAFDQAVDAGRLEDDELEKTWWTRGDKKVRSTHRPMHGQRRKLRESYRTGGGVALRYPCDENGPASETAGCRCSSVVLLPGGRVAVEGRGGGLVVMKLEDWQGSAQCRSFAA